MSLHVCNSHLKEYSQFWIKPLPVPRAAPPDQHQAPSLLISCAIPKFVVEPKDSPRGKSKFYLMGTDMMAEKSVLVQDQLKGRTSSSTKPSSHIDVFAVLG